MYFKRWAGFGQETELKTDEKRARGEVGSMPGGGGEFIEKAEKGNQGQVMEGLV